MPQMPITRKHTRTVHQWIIETPCDAKDFRFQVHVIEDRIQNLIGKKKVENDDAYRVIVGDDSIIFEVETKTQEAIFQ